jgi:hypothetical protein
VEWGCNCLPWKNLRVPGVVDSGLSVGGCRPNQWTLCRSEGAHSRKTGVYLAHWGNPNLHADCASDLWVESKEKPVS